ncbi:MAG: hypothetical protein ORO03_05825 [Alphaproteobacteria bacterium]|nr:hypothetical protein [Alphaproteobacteria bacterium]
MLGLKILVGVMSTLIVVGVTVLAFVIVGRINANANRTEYRVEIIQTAPAGSRLVEMDAVDKLLVLRYETPDHQNHFQVIDPRVGKSQGTIVLLQPAP